ncbi:AraC family transcriptional regulator [Oculatella sp. LEGE 06141]|uniref:helix-turn-helix transcriptional regulator n=1 Tax=Oculatella sp. LEGE 06141 TaxID=1828648 RepID=UPI001880C7F3|nr:AraC family transcriptional regulator [Oculatella sp. LEGE 06141]MBE9178995.1 AraC family transcriptional regulator [Oculatella sp. LEGE 06141]
MMREQVSFWRVPEMANLELLQATYITHCFTRHAHDTYAIGVIQQGAEAFAYRGSNHVAPASHIVLINPGEMHTGHAATEAGWTYSMFYPDICLLQQAVQEISQPPHALPFFTQPVVYDPWLTELMVQLHRSLARSAPALEHDSRLLWTLTQLIARHAELRVRLQPVGSEPCAVQQIRAYLEAHYAENVSLDQLAAIANLSPFYLLRSFRRQVGLPPHCYLNQIRLTQAKRLLALEYPISQVAHLVGFADQSHLTRQFKRMWGVTPGQYQKSKNVQD